MKRVLVSLALALALAPAGTASADGFYFTEGFGGGDVKNDLSGYMSSTLYMRFAVGWRRGPWALEADIGAHLGVEDGHAAKDHSDRHTYDFYSLFTWGAGLKYIQPLGEHVETYVRGGLSYGVLDPIMSEEYAGRGMRVGAGIQVKGKVRALGFLAWPFFFLKIGPKVTAGLWLDAGYDFYRLHPHGRLDATPAIDAELTAITGGFAVGSDF